MPLVKHTSQQHKTNADVQRARPDATADFARQQHANGSENTHKERCAKSVVPSHIVLCFAMWKESPALAIARMSRDSVVSTFGPIFALLGKEQRQRKHNTTQTLEK